jgi:hypothetical protein
VNKHRKLFGCSLKAPVLQLQQPKFSHNLLCKKQQLAANVNMQADTDGCKEPS